MFFDVFCTFSMYFYRSVFVSVMFICFICCFMQQLVFSVSTFADAHCKSHNLLLSWRTYMNCAHSDLKFLVTGSSEISSALMAPICGFHSHSSALTQQGPNLPKPIRTHPHSWHLFAVFTRTHPHSHNRGPNLPKPVRTHAALTCFHHFHASRTHPHSWRAASWRFRRTHPHSSARSLRLCIHASSTLASERMLSRNLCAAWMCFSIPSLPYHHPNRWLSYMSQNNIKHFFFKQHTL